MEEIDLLEQIKRRLETLQSRIESRVDPKLLAEVASTVQLADVHLPSVFMQARRVLEIIVRDIYRRELPDAKVKPLVNMIEALYEQKRLIGSKIATDLHYIRANGNLIVHPQDEAIEIRPGDAEPMLFVFLGVVEWYLTVYLPERQGEPPERLPALPPPPNPYRGLLAFREADAANWFGREPDAADLLAAVERQPLVAVVGPSGSGKSSLVYAGVVPPLRATDGMRIADFRPRGRPFAALAQALVALWPIDPADRVAQARKLAAHLAEAQATLTDAVQETLRQSGGSRLVLIADQFEELYTLGQPGDETLGFADLLVQAVQDSLPIPNRAGPPEFCLLLTLRADFLGHALAHPGLAALLDRCPPKLLGPVEDRARLRAIIEQPARGAGVALEDLLPERILRDLAQAQFSRPAGTADQVGGASLPLLEFALSQLWDRQQERRLTHRGYEELGGIQQALSRHADGVLARLDPADQARMRHVLVQMVRPGEGTEDTRQVATRDQLNPDDWPLVVRLADADTRLVVTGHDQTTDQDTAELVHEALIRYWSPLREWINADRVFRLWQNGLRQAMGEWERTGRDDGALLAGARLAEAEERIASDGGRISDAEVRYVQASVGRRDAETAERERQRRERERLQRRISFGLAGFLFVALALSGLAAWQWRLAESRGASLSRSLAQEAQAKEEAILQRDRATEQTLATNLNLARIHEEKALKKARTPANEVTTRDYRDAVLHVLQAQRLPLRAARAVRPPTWKELEHSFLGLAFIENFPQPNRLLGTGASAVAFSPDGSLLAAGSVGSVRLWDTATGSVIRSLDVQQDHVASLAFSPDGKLLASGYSKGSVRFWNPATGEQLRAIEGHQGTIDDLAFSPDGRLLATSSGQDHKVRLWDSATGGHLRTVHLHSNQLSGKSVAFGPDGRILAYHFGMGVARLEEVASGDTLQTIIPEKFSDFGDLDFTPDGLLVGSDDSHIYSDVRIWEPTTGQLVRSFSGHSADVVTIAISKDGRLLASGSVDRTIRLWNLSTGEPLGTLRGHRDYIEAIALSPNGRFVASTDSEIDLWLWAIPNLRENALLSDLPAPSPRAALMSEALQRLWGLRVDGLDVTEYDWSATPANDGESVAGPAQMASQGSAELNSGVTPRHDEAGDRREPSPSQPTPVDVVAPAPGSLPAMNERVSVDVRTAAETADPASQPILRTFDIRPLLDPPPPDKDKLDQFLDWLAEQERLEPRLRAQ